MPIHTEGAATPGRPASECTNVAAAAADHAAAVARVKPSSDSGSPAATIADDSALNRPWDAIGSKDVAASPIAIHPSPASRDRMQAEASTPETV